MFTTGPAKYTRVRVPVLVSAVTILWAAGIGFGARMLLNYENAPGAPARAPARWPSTTRITRPDAKFTLVMLAHPNCPCTRASLSELAILMARLHGKLSAFVVFGKPEAGAAQIQVSDLWKKAAAIPDVAVRFDPQGAETRGFGGQVSGQCLVYDPHGQLVFSGGITAARGHEGDNAGVDAVIARVRGESRGIGHTPAFGCSLHDPDQRELEGSQWKKL